MARQFFYDNQVRRFLLQFVRLFSNFQVEMGAPDASGVRDLVTVPVMYGDMSRNVAQVIREASENKVLSTPRMTCYIQNILLINFMLDKESITKVQKHTVVHKVMQ